MNACRVLAAACLLAALSGCGSESERYERPSGTLSIGGAAPALYLLDDGGTPYRRALPADGRITVIWFWSTLCKCVKDCEPRIKRLRDRHPPEVLHLLAVDANPDDTPEDIRRLREALAAPYEVHRDDAGVTARWLGITASASVAVLDGEGRLRYRGAIDDSLYEPQVSYVEQAVEALRAGREPETTEVPSYGCMYPVP